MKLTGKLIDVNGRQGTLELNIGDNSKQAVWKLDLYERDLSPLTMKGEFAIQMQEGKLLATAIDKIEDKEVRWEMSLTRGNPAKYAKQAFSGEYRVENAPDKLPVSQGVVIVWEFHD